MNSVKQMTKSHHASNTSSSNTTLSTLVLPYRQFSTYSWKISAYTWSLGAPLIVKA